MRSLVLSPICLSICMVQRCSTSNRSEFLGTRVFVPMLGEQRRIAAILDKADALRQKRRLALQKLDSLTQSVFLDMFGDPVANPKKWDVAPLAQLGMLDRGISKHRPRNAPELLNGPYPLIQTGEVTRSNGYVTSYKFTYSELGLKQSRLWPEGTLCITIAANIAGTGILTFPACFPDSIVGFTPNEAVTAEYVQGAFAFYKSTLQDNAPEFAQKNINLAILRQLSLPIPPKSLQDGFTNAINAIHRYQKNLNSVTVKFNDMFTSLQQRAFRGEL